MGYRYPYGNTSQLNLDWLLTSWREFQNAVLGMIAPAYDNTSRYTAGALCVYNMSLWRCKEAITTPEEFSTEHWEIVTITEVIS